MVTMELYLSLCWLILVSGVSAWDLMDSCNKSISIRCEDENYPFIHIGNFSSKSVSVSDVLQRCNGRRECQIQNTREECVGLKYHCIPHAPTLEIKRSSTVQLRTNTSLFYIMSEHYAKGQSQNADNIKCNLSTVVQGYEKSMSLIIQELSPFTNSTNYCLSVQHSQGQPYCTGSRQFISYYGPFQSNQSWLFSLNLQNRSDPLTQVRFWITIGGDMERDMYDLECTSKAAPKQGMFSLLLFGLVTLLQTSLQQ